MVWGIWEETNLNKEFTLSRLPFFYTRGTQTFFGTFKRFFFVRLYLQFFFRGQSVGYCQLHIN